jgi:hypothetical protein
MSSGHESPERFVHVTFESPETPCTKTITRSFGGGAYGAPSSAPRASVEDWLLAPVFEHPLAKLQAQNMKNMSIIKRGPGCASFMGVDMVGLWELGTKRNFSQKKVVSIENAINGT